jgi:hypothetical protein
VTRDTQMRPCCHSSKSASSRSCYNVELVVTAHKSRRTRTRKACTDSDVRSRDEAAIQSIQSVFHECCATDSHWAYIPHLQGRNCRGVNPSTSINSRTPVTMKDPSIEGRGGISAQSSSDTVTAVIFYLAQCPQSSARTMSTSAAPLDTAVA